MQVSAASSIGHNLTIANAMAEGRSQRLVSKETFGESRKPDTFDRALDVHTSKKQAYTTYEMKKAQLTTQQSQPPQSTPVASQTAVTADTATTVKFTQDDIQTLLKLFGTSVGDDGFLAQFDLDGNGTIDLDDLDAMLNHIAQGQQAASTPQSQFTQADIDLLLAAFGAQVGDEAYDEALDLNGDGIIGLDDLDMMLANFTNPQNGPESPAGSAIDQLMAAFGLNKGDDGFVAELDLNGDGTIDLNDLDALLSSMSA